ncbi:MAG: DNA translocase FtsK 4TM domain-containing protein [Prevotella sp.]|nr:DNA translocase FtsK 4TM domain-containing protein [Candidatus Prevotella equi]
MAKSRKTTKAKKDNVSFKSALGFNNMFSNEKTNFTVGISMFFLAILTIICFVSYFNTAAADQSLVLNPLPGDFANAGHEFHNYCGSWGAYISHFFIAVCFGLPAFLFPVFFLICSMSMMGVYKLNLWKWFFGLMVVMLWSSVTCAKFINPFLDDQVYNAGGGHGQFICETLENVVGTPGLTCILALTAIFFLTYLSSETITLIRTVLNPKRWIEKVPFSITNANKEGEIIDPETTSNDETEPEVYDNPSTQTVEFDVNSNNAVVTDTGYDTPTSPATEQEGEIGMEIAQGIEEESAGGKVVVGNVEMSAYDPKATLSRYKYPTLDLLKKYDTDGKSFIDMDEQKANKERIVEVLGNFGVQVSSIKATVGPTITLYEITLAPGIKISKVRSLEDDIALSLAALGIRIIAPIPGKGTIGIEVPNANPQVVSMESILNSRKFQESKMALPLALGKTISNEIYMVDLAKIPHLLVAGATGQGKSVGLNAIITSLLYKKHPAELKFVLVDPKMVEFSIYKPLLNHFLAQIPPESDADEPIITDVTKVVKTLNSVCQEMDDRYNLLKFANVRKLEEYNEKFVNRQLNPENGHRYLPYIVVIIDEYGDLIMTAGKEIELPIARIAQKARAVGIHMIIATQRPTTNIITGTIKANFPGRMAFKVMSQIDSRTILDGSGANQLIGRGDMLILDKGTPVRVQCAFVDTPEVLAINNFIAEQRGYDGPFELPEPMVGEEGGGAGNAEDLSNLDQLFGEAARVIVMSQQGSTSLIQRKFSIGYNRAGRLMDQLEKAGVVGAAHGSKPREVLIQDENTLQSLLNTLGIS